MAFRKSPLLSTAASLIALSALTGCATTDNMFSSREPVSAEAYNAANYEEAMKRGHAAKQDGDYENAATSFMRAAEYEPDSTDPLIELADVLWQQKKAAESAKVLEHALTMDSQNDTVLRNLGRAYVALNQPAKAQQSYLAALAIDPNSARTLNGLAISYDMGGDYETAEGHYRAGLALEPNNVDIKNNLAYSLITAQKYNDAIVMLEPLVKHPAATSRQRSNLALAYGLTGHYDEARLALAIDLAPAQIEQNIATYRQMRGEPAQATALTGVGRPTFERGNLAMTEPAPMAAPPVAVTAVTLPPPAPSELVGVPEGAVLVKPAEPVYDEPAPAPRRSAASTPPRQEPATSPVPAAVQQPEPARPQPTDLVATTTPAATPAQPATSLPAPSSNVVTSGLGNAKIYLGRFENEAIARETWIRVWTGNSTALGSLVASIEPNDGQMALYAVGADSSATANGICTKLRQNGVSCGVAN